MTATDNAITTDQYIASNPLFLYQDNSLESPKQDKDTSVLTDYGYVVGSEHEDVSNEALEQIQEGIFGDTLQLPMSKWLHGESPWDFNIAFPTFHQVPESLSTDVEENIDKDTIWAEIIERFDVIAQREDNWDELESQKPIEESLVRAKRLIEQLLDDILFAGYSWRMFKPLISSDEDGYITVRWIGEGKRLHFQFKEKEVEYITLERINTKREMGGDTIRDEQCFDIWEWLING
jgi:hypothetical protein